MRMQRIMVGVEIVEETVFRSCRERSTPDKVREPLLVDTVEE